MTAAPPTVAAARDDPATPALEVERLDFSYGRVQVLFGIDLTVPTGEVVALLGTNGAGKSTVLKAVCGLVRPSNGTVRLFGEDVTGRPAEQLVAAGVVQVPGGRATFPSLTVEENLRAGTWTFRRQRALVASRLERVLDLFPELAGRLDAPAGTLSGGQQQMLALGRALVCEPRLLLIDELSLGLAPVVVERLLDAVRALNAAGVTIVIVEQSLNVALSIATTAYFLERGTVRFGGPAHELRDRDDIVRSVFLEGATAPNDPTGGGRPHRALDVADLELNDLDLADLDLAAAAGARRGRSGPAAGAPATAAGGRG